MNWYTEIKSASPSHVGPVPKSPIAHVTTTAAIKNGVLSHPGGHLLFWADFVDDPDLSIWAKDIVGEYGGQPVKLIMRTDAAIRKYRWEAQSGIEGEYFATRGPIQMSDVEVHPL